MKFKRNSHNVAFLKITLQMIVPAEVVDKLVMLCSLRALM